jgi:hypothetical protein
MNLHNIDTLDNKGYLKEGLDKYIDSVYPREIRDTKSKPVVDTISNAFMAGALTFMSNSDHTDMMKELIQYTKDRMDEAMQKGKIS